MTTLATIALNCAKQLGRANADGTEIADLETEIKDEIRQSIIAFNRKPWHLLETREVMLTTVDGQSWYDTVTVGASDVSVRDVLTIQYMREETSSLRDGLRHIQYQYFEELQQGTPIGGTPIYYTRYGDQIGIYPIPSAAYEVTFSAVVKPVAPIGDSSESIWFDEASELIEAASCSRICLKYLRDAQRAQEFGSIAQGAMDALHGEYIRKTRTGRITPHC